MFTIKNVIERVNNSINVRRHLNLEDMNKPFTRSEIKNALMSSFYDIEKLSLVSFFNYNRTSQTVFESIAKEIKEKYFTPILFETNGDYIIGFNKERGYIIGDKIDDKYVNFVFYNDDNSNIINLILKDGDDFEILNITNDLVEGSEVCEFNSVNATIEYFFKEYKMNDIYSL